jgi:hypothetical protein
MEPVILLVGRSAVADQLVGARATDPVVEPVERRRVARGTRWRIAVALRATADRLAPAERPLPQATAGC